MSRSAWVVLLEVWHNLDNFGRDFVSHDFLHVSYAFAKSFNLPEYSPG
jgi:hypothetical protein